MPCAPSARAGLLAALLLTGAAWGQQVCRDVTTVETRGYPSTLEGTDAGADGVVEQAIQDALAQAIAEVRGAFIRQETELVDRAVTKALDTHSTTRTTTLEERIETQASGLILGYDVLAQDVDPATSLPRVTVRARVCNDPRLAVQVGGRRQGATSFTDEVARALVDSGWAAATVASGTAPLRAALDTGASHMARVEFHSREQGTWRGLEQVDVTLHASIVDMLGNTFVAGFTRTETGTGRTDAEAIAATMPALAATLVQAFNDGVGAPTQARVTLTFGGVTMPHTPGELERILRDTGRITDLDTHWDRSAGIIQVRAETGMDACGLADRAARTRRLLVQTDSCTHRRATLQVLRQ